MDPSLTRTKAHVLFGELYSKPRSQEWQAKVDRAIQGVSDIYVRIHKIQEVDEEFERINRTSSAMPANRSGTSRQATSGGTGARMAGGAAQPSSLKDQPSPFAKEPAINLMGKVFRFLAGLFRKSDVAIWGEKTGTISTGLFGMNQHLTLQVHGTFSVFPQGQVVEILKVFRYFVAKGWESFPPEKYNVVVTCYQFFEEYLKVDVLFKKQEPIPKIIAGTTKLQVLYAQLLQFEDAESFLKGEFVEWMTEQKEVAVPAPDLNSSLEVLLGFETRRPKLTDCLLALYIVDRKRLVSWNELCNELKLHPPVLDHYRAPEKTMVIIQQRVDKLKNDLAIRKRSVNEIEGIRSRYFQLDEKGRANVDFIQEIAKEILTKSTTEGRISVDFIKSTMVEPHRLLSVLMRDMDLNFFPMLCGSVTSAGGGTSELIVFRPGVFKSEVDLFNELQQDLAEFHKRYKSAGFNFAMFLAAIKGEAKDPVSQAFRSIAMRGNTLFGFFLTKIRSVLYAHAEAVEKEQNGTLKETLQRTKSIPIETSSGELRFIPWADVPIIANSRFNGLTVQAVLEEMVHCLYNYMYVFRDSALLNTLSSVPRLKSEIGLLEKKLLQYGSGT